MNGRMEELQELLKKHKEFALKLKRETEMKTQAKVSKKEDDNSILTMGNGVCV